MRLVTFQLPGGGADSVRAGIHLEDGRILDLAEADAQFEDTSVLDVVAHSDYLLPRAQALAATVDEIHPGAFVSEREVQLLAPIPRPVSMRDGYAFRQHVETARRNRGLGMIPEFDLFPVFYFTNHLAVIGPGVLRVGGARLKFDPHCAATAAL